MYSVINLLESDIIYRQVMGIGERGKKELEV